MGKVSYVKNLIIIIIIIINSRQIKKRQLSSWNVISVILDPWVDSRLWLCFFTLSRVSCIISGCSVDPQTEPPDLGCESACRQLSSTTTIAIYYYYDADPAFCTQLSQTFHTVHKMHYHYINYSHFNIIWKLSRSDVHFRTFFCS